MSIQNYINCSLEEKTIIENVLKDYSRNLNDLKLTQTAIINNQSSFIKYYQSHKIKKLSKFKYIMTLLIEIIFLLTSLKYIYLISYPILFFSTGSIGLWAITSLINNKAINIIATNYATQKLNSDIKNIQNKIKINESLQEKIAKENKVDQFIKDIKRDLAFINNHNYPNSSIEMQDLNQLFNTYLNYKKQNDSLNYKATINEYYHQLRQIESKIIINYRNTQYDLYNANYEYNTYQNKSLKKN